MTAFQCAIESVVRAVGRIVVCVEAEAEVSTAMISSLSSVPPSTPRAERVEHVFLVGFVGQEAVPWKDWAAAVTTT